MDSSAVSRTRAGQGVGAECVGLGLQTGRVHTRYGLTRPVGLEPIEPDINKLAGSVGPGCPAGAAAVPRGGTRGGIQRSALWPRWDKRFSNLAGDLGLANGAGPTAHRSNYVFLRVRPLRVLLLVPDCCTARPSWTVVS